MSSQRAPRREWNEKKAIILGLSTNNPLKELARLMSERHQFTATLAQYEYHLKEWNAPRKNLKRGEWEKVLAVYDLLVSQHGTVRVLVNDIPVSTTKLHRNRRLYASVGLDSHTTGREAVLPEAVSFQLQSADGRWLHLDPDPHIRELDDRASPEGTRVNDTIPAPDLPSPSLVGAGAQLLDEEDTGHWTASSPVNVSESSLFGDGALPRSRAFDTWGTRDEPRAEQGGVGLDFRNASSPHTASPDFPAAVSAPALFGDLDLSSHLNVQPCLALSPPPPSPPSRFGGIDVDAIAADCQIAAVASLPFERPAEILARQLRSMFLDLEKHAIRPYTWGLYPSYGAASFHPTECRHDFGNDVPRQNRRLLPGCRFDTIGYGDCLEATVLNTDIPRWLLFALANNFAGLQNAQISKITPWISQSSNGSSFIQQLLRDKQNPQVKAMGASLLKACIEAQNVTAFRQILSSGAVDIDVVVLYIKGVRYSALGRSAALQNLSLVQAILEFQPRIAKSSMGSDAFGHLLASLESYDTSISSDFEEIASLLYKANAFMDPELLFHRLMYDSRVGFDFAFSFVLKMAPTRHEELILAGSLRRIIGESQNEDVALNFVKEILDVCYGEHQWACSQNIKLREHFEMALIQSAEAGYFGLAKVLLPFGVGQIKYEFLLASIFGGSKEIVDLALSQHPNLDHPLELATTTALAAAILSQSEDLIQIIKKKGCLEYLHIEGHFQEAITAAVETRNLAQVQELFQHHPHFHNRDVWEALRISVDEEYDDITFVLTDACLKEDPLLQAVLLRNWPVVHALLDSGPTDMQPKRHHELLMEWQEVFPESQWSILFEHLIETGDHRLILKAAERFPVRTNDARHWEVRPEKMNREVLQFLCEQKLVSRGGLTRYLQKALMHEDDSMVHLTIQIGANPIDQTVLELAVTYSPHLLSFLLSQVPRPMLEFVSHNFELGDDAVQQALNQGLEGLPSLRLLLESGIVDLSDLRMWHPCGSFYPEARFRAIVDLRVAIMKTTDLGNFAVVRYLLDIGCDPNTHELAAVLEKSGERPWLSVLQTTALLEAVVTSHVGLVELLIEKGANVNQRTVGNIDRTPIQKAAELGYLDILKLLLDRGADVNAPAAPVRGGGTALQLAAIGGNCAVACELLERGADWSMPPCEDGGRWPLEGAAEHGRVSMIELLWEYCNGGFPDSVVDRAMELAKENGHVGCKEVLERLRASKRVFDDAAGVDWTVPFV